MPAGRVTQYSEAEARTVSATFVRRIPRSSDLVDLLDIVVGGNGSMRRRERGIDPVTGSAAPVFLSRWRQGDGRYHHVPERPPVDGVFVPDGRKGPVQLDSAGHTFDGFSATTGKVFGVIWAARPTSGLKGPTSNTGSGSMRWDADGIYA